MNITNRWSRGALAAGCLISLSGVAAAELPTRLLALRGQQVPGMPPGTVWEQFPGRPSINSDGHVAFTVSITGNMYGSWSDRSGQLEPVFFQGSQIPGMPPGSTFGGWSGLQLQDDGHIVIANTVTGSPANRIWSDLSGKLLEIPLLNKPVNAAEEGLFVKEILGATFNGTDQCLLYIRLGGPGVTASNDEAFVTNASGEIELLARKGYPIPGEPLGSPQIFSTLTADRYLINNAGTVAFIAQHKILNGITRYGAWTTRSGALEGVSGEVSVDGLFFNNAGDWGFRRRVPPPPGISLSYLVGMYPHGESGGDMSFPAPGVLANTGWAWRFDLPLAAAVNGLGQVATVATHAIGAEPYTYQTAIWSNVSGVMRPLVSVGDLAPDTVGEVYFSSFSEPVLNNRGQLVFTATLQGPPPLTSLNNIGVWVADSRGNLRNMLRTGVWFNASGNPQVPDNRVVNPYYNFYYISGISEAGFVRGFNDRGELAIRITFNKTPSDFSQIGVYTGYFVITAPPPQCDGDANNDGVVNFADITSVIGNWGATYPTNVLGAGDANDNDVVDFDDVNAVLTNWLSACD